MLQSPTTLKRDTSSANVTKTWHSRGLGMRYLGLHSESQGALHHSSHNVYISCFSISIPK